jgi:integrase
VINGHPVIKPPKSERGGRTLPLDAPVVAALQALNDRQVTEAMEAGGAYAGSGYVVCDELGAAVNPEWYSDEFHRLRERAGLPRIRLHHSRHTANSLMAAAGVPEHIRAAWCGHTVAVNKHTYTHARPEDLAVALDVLSKISKPA